MVIDELRARGADVRVFSGGRAADFIRSLMKVDDVVRDAAPRTAGLEMSRVAAWYVRAWFAQKGNVRRVGRLFDAYRPDLVVCDEEFSGMTVAEARGAKRVFLADELELGFARSWVARKLEGRVEGWYRRLLMSVDLLVVPEDGDDSGNRRFVGPIVRRFTLDPEAVRMEHGLPRGRMVLFSMSGSGIGRELFGRVVAAAGVGRPAGAFLVVTGNRGPKLGGEGVYDLGVVADNQNLIAAADVVISTAGKSTIDEAAAAGTPIIPIPIRHHAEQERNASALGYSSGDADRLAELVAEKMGTRGAPRAFDGGTRSADLILSLA